MAEDKRRRGRPAVNATTILARLRPAEIDHLDKAIEASGLDLSRPEALRRLVQNAKPTALKERAMEA
jgi:hypothetical protein